MLSSIPYPVAYLAQFISQALYKRYRESASKSHRNVQRPNSIINYAESLNCVYVSTSHSWLEINYKWIQSPHERRNSRGYKACGLFILNLGTSFHLFFIYFERTTWVCLFRSRVVGRRSSNVIMLHYLVRNYETRARDIERATIARHALLHHVRYPQPPPRLFGRDTCTACITPSNRVLV